jgi:hypothetical protein
MNPKVFAGLIAFLLLLIYFGSIGYMIFTVVKCGGGPQCQSIEFTSGVIYSVTLIGGLVSALVITKLAITSPGGALSMTSSEKNVEGLEKFAAASYLIIWLITGLASFFIGEIFYPGASGTLSDIGKTWIGLAISATYSYFGVKPPDNK